jgi:hypothetical protein
MVLSISVAIFAFHSHLHSLYTSAVLDGGVYQVCEWVIFADVDKNPNSVLRNLESRIVFS